MKIPHSLIFAAIALNLTILYSPAISAESQTGISSIYSNEKTANGEYAYASGLTAAHRTLPFGTRVEVTNLRNGRRVIVRINDRGPFIRGRVIDLTPAAARAIGSDGLAPVSLDVVGTVASNLRRGDRG